MYMWALQNFPLDCGPEYYLSSIKLCLLHACPNPENQSQMFWNTHVTLEKKIPKKPEWQFVRLFALYCGYVSCYWEPTPSRIKYLQQMARPKFQADDYEGEDYLLLRWLDLQTLVWTRDFSGAHSLLDELDQIPSRRSLEIPEIRQTIRELEQSSELGNLSPIVLAPDESFPHDESDKVQALLALEDSRQSVVAQLYQLFVVLHEVPKNRIAFNLLRSPRLSYKHNHLYSSADIFLAENLEFFMKTWMAHQYFKGINGFEETAELTECPTAAFAEVCQYNFEVRQSRWTLEALVILVSANILEIFGITSKLSSPMTGFPADVLSTDLPEYSQKFSNPSSLVITRQMGELGNPDLIKDLSNQGPFGDQLAAGFSGVQRVMGGEYPEAPAFFLQFTRRYTRLQSPTFDARAQQPRTEESAQNLRFLLEIFSKVYTPDSYHLQTFRQCQLLAEAVLANQPLENLKISVATLCANLKSDFVPHQHQGFMAVFLFWVGTAFTGQKAWARSCLALLKWETPQSLNYAPCVLKESLQASIQSRDSADSLIHRQLLRHISKLLGP